MDSDPPNLANEESPYLKIILLGDSAVGKSKLFERFLLNDYKEFRYSTYALTLYRHYENLGGEKRLIHFWDTAGQEQFQKMHPSYYHSAHACILVFDVLRKITYKHLQMWYDELRKYRPEIPCLLVANKIDANPKATELRFNFSKKKGIVKMYYASASDGTNVVQIFNEAIKFANDYKLNTTDYMDSFLEELDRIDDQDVKAFDDDSD